MKVPFKLIYAPSKDLKTRCMRGRYRKMPQSEMENLTKGIVTEERLHTLATMCCPFCMERYYNSFYSKRYDAYMNALQAGTTQQKFGSDQHEMRRAGESEEVYFRRGIIENEIDILCENNIIIKNQSSLGAEDFTYFLEKTRGVFFNLGYSNKKLNSPIHTSTFNIYEN